VFSGNWEPLRGKTVKVYSVKPAQSSTLETSPREKRNFVKELFLRVSKEHSETDTVTVGVVVVFDSPDGGQASATLASLAQWQQGKLSEPAFWQACSLDPPEGSILRPRSNKYFSTDNGHMGRHATAGLGVLPCIIKGGEDGPAVKSGPPNSKIPWRKSRLFAKRLQAWCATVMSSRWKASLI
jgi:hypothetical protein